MNFTSNIFIIRGGVALSHLALTYPQAKTQNKSHIRHASAAGHVRQEQAGR